MRSFLSFLLSIPIAILLALMVAIVPFSALAIFYINISETAAFERVDKKPVNQEEPSS